jgi:hypothetical protein
MRNRNPTRTSSNELMKTIFKIGIESRLPAIFLSVPFRRCAWRFGPFGNSRFKNGAVDQRLSHRLGVLGICCLLAMFECGLLVLPSAYKYTVDPLPVFYHVCFGISAFFSSHDSDVSILNSPCGELAFSSWGVVISTTA